jgi:putative FmdB family regulatory protein
MCCVDTDEGRDYDAAMPIYEYRCEKCGEFERTQRISDPPLQRCPTCRRKVRRLISSTSFQLKGSGWYVTDYARGGEKKKGGEAAGDSASNGSAPAASESKAKSESTSKPASDGKAGSGGGKSATAGSDAGS